VLAYILIYTLFSFQGCSVEVSPVVVMADECFFKFKFQCDGRQEKLTECGLNRIENIIRCSEIYLDGIDKLLEKSLRENRDFTIKCHKSCVSTYTSTTQIRYRDISNELSKLKNLL